MLIHVLLRMHVLGAMDPVLDAVIVQSTYDRDGVKQESVALVIQSTSGFWNTHRNTNAGGGKGGGKQAGAGTSSGTVGQVTVRVSSCCWCAWCGGFCLPCFCDHRYKSNHAWR